MIIDQIVIPMTVNKQIIFLRHNGNLGQLRECIEYTNYSVSILRNITSVDW